MHRHRASILAASALLLTISAPMAWANTATERVSVTSSGQQANGLWPSISADGRYIAFSSHASSLTGSGFDNVFVRDRIAKTTTMVGVTPTGKPAGNSCGNPVISRDGHFVAFQTAATDIVPGRNGVMLRNLQTNTTRAVSIGTGGQSSNGIDYTAAVSATGRYVAFFSSATNLVAAPGLSRGVFQLYVRDMTTGKITLETVSPKGVAGNRGGQLFDSVSITPEGRYLAFSSYSDNLVAGDTNLNEDVFLRDRQTGKTVLVSVDTGGGQFRAYSYAPFVSDWGRLVAFSSRGGGIGRDNVLVRDMENKTTTLLSLGAGGEQGDVLLRGMNQDGRFLVVTTNAGNLVPNDTNGFWDVFLYDRKAGKTTRLSVSSTSVQGNGNSGYGAGLGSFPGLVGVSAKGTVIAFPSTASNLVGGDTNGAPDVFLRVLPVQTSP